jgi:hypothetical protein
MVLTGEDRRSYNKTCHSATLSSTNSIRNEPGASQRLIHRPLTDPGSWSKCWTPERITRHNTRHGTGLNNLSNREGRKYVDIDTINSTSIRSHWARSLRPRPWSLGRWNHGFVSRLRRTCLSSSIHHRHSLVTLTSTLYSYRDSVVK